jgi:hypothetical protein
MQKIWKLALSVSNLIIMLPIGTSVMAEQASVDIRYNIALQSYSFWEDPLYSKQDQQYESLTTSPELYWHSEDNKNTIEFIPYVAIDLWDGDTHGDIRDLSWNHLAWNTEIWTGIRRVFWGVTEFQHLVDVINQIDASRHLDNEIKLGQPMISVSNNSSIGILDFYVLPYFRERVFTDTEGRPQLPLLNADDPLYESKDGAHHRDFAFRWSKSVSAFDLAVSWFDGTSRDPRFVPSVQNPFLFVPLYPQIQQLGAELQASFGSALWKLEAIQNNNRIEDYWAYQAGLEISQYGFLETKIDVSWLIEYGQDQLGERSHRLYQNDLFAGGRIALNDTGTTSFLVGLAYDRDYHSRLFKIEGDTRIGENIKLAMNLWLINAGRPSDVSSFFRQDDHVNLDIIYYF